MQQDWLMAPAQASIIYGRCRMKTIDVKRAITLFFFMPRDKKIRANDTRAAMRFHLFKVHVNLKFEVKCRGRLKSA
jgi:hypothetical protein